jgi:Zn finger protein HypA/HybF involved in hydrogenase expression
MALACPSCGSRNLRPSECRTSQERLNELRFVSPLRCKDCRTRFISRTIFPEEIFYARCPECDHLDLSAWTGKTYRAIGWTKIKVALGAHKWRCEYCRLNFASFRKRKEAFGYTKANKTDLGPAGKKEPPSRA